ncbi:MAG: S9 family peptidase, partial [Acidobacteria bacterium]|nr:S9 family peptidase [Acidobacteriota bacterium]
MPASRHSSLVRGLLGLALLLPAGLHLGASGTADPQTPPEQARPLTVEQLISAPTVSELVASPAGRAVAWVVSERGSRNVWVAEGEGLRPRRLTSFDEDDGQAVSELRWTPDGRAVVFVRGNGSGASGGPLNPSSAVASATRDVWVAPLDNTAPRRIGPGSTPEVSPTGDLIAFIRGNEVWAAPVSGSSPAARLFAPRWQVSSLAWAPDGAALAFMSTRGSHGLIGIFHRNRQSFEYVSPSVDRDLYPRWSPDGRHLAFVRMENVETKMRSSGRFGAIDSPWVLMVATRGGPTSSFGMASPVWRAPLKPIGSFPRTFQFLEWTPAGHLVFASEHENWVHLYLIDPAQPAARPSLLTPGACEATDATLAADGRTIFVASNCGDLERRHLGRIPLSAGTGAAARVEALTRGTGIETSPAALADGRTLVFLRADARTPASLRVLSLADHTESPLSPAAISAPIPAAQLVDPELAVFKAADGLEIRSLVWAPRQIPGAPRDRRPALVHVHGGPTAGQELMGWQPIYQYYAARGYVVLGLNYRGGAGYGRSFREVPTQGVQGAAEYQDVVAAAEYLRSRPDVDPRRIGIWGGSYGGYLTQLALARNSDLYSAGVSECGIFNLASNARNPLDGEAARIARDSSAAGAIDR